MKVDASRLVPASVAEFFAAIWAQPLSAYYLRPVSTLAAAAMRMGPERRNQRRYAKEDAAIDLGEVRDLAMATSILFVPFGVGPLAVATQLGNPWRAMVAALGGTFLAVPVATIFLCHVTVRAVDPYKLLERVASRDLGRRLDAYSWAIALACGLAVGLWISTQG
jgi:hypothetical protein